MNEDTAKEILTELRKLSKYAGYHRKIQKGSLIFGIIFLPLFFGGMAYYENKVKKDYAISETAEENWSWYKVTADEEKGRLDDALEKAQYLIKLSPNYSYGLKKLGRVYLERNELIEAKESFEKAYNIFPSESNKECLDAIKKRIEKEKES